MSEEKGLTYKDSGVDIDKADKLVDSIKEITKKTNTPGVVSEIGGFGGYFSLDLAGYKGPILVSSTDGVGTKLKIAFMMDKHDTVGIDLVAMCANDVAVAGGKPLFMLDYLATGKLKVGTAKTIISGISDGCVQAGCALIGGETAEMPGFYHKGEYDLSGFVIGAVNPVSETKVGYLFSGNLIHAGCQLLGVASSGLHSNGYSLVRKLFFNVLKWKIDRYIDEFGRTLGEELLEPTRIYTKIITDLVDNTVIVGLAHITGGGLIDNIARILPDGCAVQYNENSWETLPIFQFIEKAGRVEKQEMLRTFNNGIGLVIVVPDTYTEEVRQHLINQGETVYHIGEVVNRKKGGDIVNF